MVSGSQALEKVWLFSVPLHPMLILWKHTVNYRPYDDPSHKTTPHFPRDKAVLCFTPPIRRVQYLCVNSLLL